MAVKLNPYISFKDNAREAMEFYKNVFGGSLTINTFKESNVRGDSDGDKVMHAMLLGKNDLTIMASDTPPGMEFNEGAQISISLSGDNDEELQGYWTGLSNGATILMPLEKAPWGDTFGMLMDKFNINWLVNISEAKSS